MQVELYQRLFSESMEKYDLILLRPINMLAYIIRFLYVKTSLVWTPLLILLRWWWHQIMFKNFSVFMSDTHIVLFCVLSGSGFFPCLCSGTISVSLGLPGL